MAGLRYWTAKAGRATDLSIEATIGVLIAVAQAEARDERDREWLEQLPAPIPLEEGGCMVDSDYFLETAADMGYVWREGEWRKREAEHVHGE